jgi:ribonuclease-3
MYSELENRLGYKFKNIKNLQKALIHKSYAIDKGYSYYNERLEFLGDSVLGLCVAHYLFEKYPDKDEGQLSKIKSFIVSKDNLYKLAIKLNLNKYIKISTMQGDIEKKGNIMADCLEAIIGAIYLDGGIEMAYPFIKKFLTEDEYVDNDFKSKLQEIAQKEFKTLPVYDIINTRGPEHDKIFTVNVSIKGKVLSTGKGKSKKEAEQDAARKALSVFTKTQRRSNDFEIGRDSN